VRLRAFGVVGGAEGLDSALLLQAVDLLEFPGGAGAVDAVGLAAALVDDGEDGYVGRAVGDVDHVLNGDAAVGGGDAGVDVDFGVFVAALVDFEYRACLGGVVEHVAEVGEDVAFVIEVFDEFAAPDAVEVGVDAAAKDHLYQAGADDVVLETDFVMLEFLDSLDSGLQCGEEFGQPGIELQLRAKLAQHFIGEPGENAAPDVFEDVVEIENFGGDLLAAARAVFFRQRVDFGPERLLVDAEFLEQRLLHVAGDQRLVEVPDDGDDGLGK